MSEQLIRNPYKFKVIPKDYLHHHILLLSDDKKISWYDLPQIFEMFWILEEGV